MKIIKRIEQEVNRHNFIYRTGNEKNNTYDFQNYETIKSLEEKIYSGIIVLNDAFEEKINLKNEIDKFYESKKQNENKKKKGEKVLTYENASRKIS